MTPGASKCGASLIQDPAYKGATVTTTMNPAPDHPETFAAAARAARSHADLARCALLLGRIADPALRPEPALAELDAYADRALASLPSPQAAPDDLVAAVRRVLFQEAGFRGDRNDYDNPLNSSLHAVLERRLGLPITLSILFLAVAERVGLQGDGVGAPGHFLVKYRDASGEQFLDPFAGAAPVQVEPLRRRVRELLGPEASVDAALVAVTPRQLLLRVLANLRGAYVRRRDDPRALATVEHLVALTPWALDAIRDRGLLRHRTGDFVGALADLSAYREHSGAASDIDQIDLVIRHVRTRIGQSAEGPADR